MNQYLVLALVAVFLYVLFSQNPSEPSQRDIQDLSFATDREESGILTGPVSKVFKSVSYPQISHGFKQLTKGELPKPLKDLVTRAPSSFTRVRHLDRPDTMSPERRYLPDYYRKDTMDGDDQSQERRAFVNEEGESEQAWTDDNVAEHPKYYNSTLEHDELTNIGAFFDRNNQFNDTRSSHTRTLPSDNCYQTKQGDKFCMDTTRSQVVPPALITDPQDNYALNAVGMYKDSNRIPMNPKRVMNGGWFGDVLGTKRFTDGPAAALSQPYGSCSV
jgi:hypothetical protein